MLLSVIEFAAGMAAVIYGAELLTNGASALARRLRVSELVIGLTIVAMGTSLPEFVISVGASVRGNSGIALGNVLGSNIANGLLILGVAALVAPIKFGAKMLTRELPFNILASVVLLLVSGTMLTGGGEGEYITRNGGLLLLCFLAVFVSYTFSIAKTDGEEQAGEVLPMWRIVVYITGGLVALIVGGDVFVSGASELARLIGWSEAVIGLTVVAVGTSLPEFAVSVNAARKGNSGIALGNVIGSNVLNVFFILGCSATIAPISLAEFVAVDFYVLLASSLLIYLVGRFGANNTITRTEGALLVAVYIVYIAWLLVNV